MAGTLSVSHIQGLATHSDPTTITVSSGHKLHATNHVINYYRHMWKNATAYGNTAWTDVTGSSFSYTPKSSNSKLFLTMSTHIKRDSVSNGSGVAIRLQVDGTTQEFPNDIGYEHYHALGTSGSTYWRYYKDHEYTNSNTTAKTIKCQVRCYDSDSNTVNEGGSNFTSSILVLEVQQ